MYCDDPDEDRSNTLETDTELDQKPVMASETAWQRISGEQSLEERREIGRRAADRLRRGSRRDFYNWCQIIAVCWFARSVDHLGGDEYKTECEEKIGISYTSGKNCVHLYKDLPAVIKWAEGVAGADRVRTGHQEGRYPTLEQIIKQFPPPPSAQAKSKQNEARPSKKT
jgi:hypothetical protein